MSIPRSLRVAFLLPSFPELSNTFIMEQVTGLIDRGHEVDLFAVTAKSFATLPAELAPYALEDRMRHLSIPRSRLRRTWSALRILTGPAGLHRANLDALDVRWHGRRAWDLTQLHTAASFVRAGPYDVLHCQFGNLGPVGERLVRAGAVGAALVTSFRGADLSVHYPAHPRRFSALFSRGDLHLPVCDEFRTRLLAAGAPPERIAVHHSGIDLERFAFVERGPPTGTFKLLFVGRLSEKKGVAYAIEALAHLIGGGRSAELTVIGDGALEHDLRARALSLGLSQRVRFYGSRSRADVASAMRAAHVLVAPSVTARDGDQEGIPNVLKEAMASGLPVVSTRHAGIPELIEHGVTGFLAPEHDAELLAEYMTVLMDQPERSAIMARAARAKVEAEFDTQRLNDSLVTRYREAVARRAAGQSPIDAD